MFTAIRAARVNDKFQDSLYLFLELIRAGVMHGHLWSHRAFSGGPSFGTGGWSPDFSLSCVHPMGASVGVGSWVKLLSLPRLTFFAFSLDFLPRAFVLIGSLIRDHR